MDGVVHHLLQHLVQGPPTVGKLEVVLRANTLFQHELCAGAAVLALVNEVGVVAKNNPFHLQIIQGQEPA